MSDQSDNLTFWLRRQLDAGRPAEDVVRELIARGMTRSTAERFVDRANIDRSSAPSWAASGPAPPPRLSPRARAMLLAAVPCVALAIVAGAFGWRAMQHRREAQRAAAAELAAADTSRADLIRAESTRQREVANRERSARLDARLEAAVRNLASDRPMTQCDAALLIGRLGNKDHAGPLVHALSSARSTSVRGCAASALVSLGETAPAMAAFTEWANGNDGDLRRSALMGFGEVGPSAADVALPHLAEALKSPHMDVRYLAVESLSKLGPAAVSLLEVAAKDADKNVRERAASVLAAGGKPAGR